ncbi:MAG TPA: hypothetical protein PLG43_07505 [Spirochaetia bacterium]|nr:hypothetical protein [Spirochaetia bacterium]
MKFKLVFVLFNVVIIGSFLFIFLMPLGILGADYAGMFIKQNWFLPLIFIGILAVMDSYFIMNFKLFGLLEKEDWKGCAVYLEEQVMKRHRIRTQYVKLLINAYLVTSNTEKIKELEIFIRKEKPKLLNTFALEFSIPYLLANEPSRLISYLEEFLNEKVPQKGWILWCYAFALLLLQKHSDAKERLFPLAKGEKDPLLRLLSLYMLDPFTTDDEEVKACVEEGVAALKKKYTATSWNKVMNRYKENVLVVILSRVIEEATTWLFPENKNQQSKQDQ